MIITGLYAGLFAILLLCLTLNVVRLRREHKIGLLDEGNIALRKAIRMHGNATETIPILLILMGVAESNAASPLLLHIIGSVGLFCRILHAFGISKSSGVSKGRLFGMLGTCLVILFLAIFNIVCGLIAL